MHWGGDRTFPNYKKSLQTQDFQICVGKSMQVLAMISYICTRWGLKRTLHPTIHMKGKCVHHNSFSPFANNASAQFPMVSLPSSSCFILSPLRPWTALHFSRRFRGRQRDLCVYTPAPPTRGWGTPKTWLERAEPQFSCGVSTLNTSLADPMKGVQEAHWQELVID